MVSEAQSEAAASVRGRAVGWIYVSVVAGVAALGFLTDATAVILLAAVLALPCAAVTLPGYYVAYGLLAQLPGADPPTGGGWLWIAADAVGILALTAGALANVVLWRMLLAARRRPRRPDDVRQGPSAG